MSTLFRNVVYPAWHWAKRDGVNRANRELGRNQWLPTQELIALQQRKLTSLLVFAGKNVPYYRNLFASFGISAGSAIPEEVLQTIPPLTKAIIRREEGALVSGDLSGNRLFSNSTSGSTGEATRFYTDLRSTPFRRAAGRRSNEWTGWRIGDRYVSLWGAPIDQKVATNLRGKLHGWVTRHRFLSSFGLSESAMDEYVQTIRSFKPILLIAYPGPLEVFAIHCRERGVTFPSIKAIVSSAETLWPQQRHTIEQIFGVKVFDRYGSREVGQIGSECEVHDGLHISADRLLVEVVNDAGMPCAPLEEGRILITDLDNYGMPLIRYDIGDRGVPTEQKTCRCGRGLPMLGSVVGRTLEIIRTPDGRRIGGTFWTLLLRSRPGLKQFQVVQDRLGGVIIKFVRESDFDKTVLEYFRARIQEYCGRDFGVEFAEKDSIDLTASGKRRLIVSLLDEHRDSA